MTAQERALAKALYRGDATFEGKPLPSVEDDPRYIETFLPNRLDPSDKPQGSEDEVRYWVACELADDLLHGPRSPWAAA